MKKLSLDLDTLAVESFDVSTVDEGARGTVHGNDLGVQATYKKTCISCTGYTDPCLCDPFHPSGRIAG